MTPQEQSRLVEVVYYYYFKQLPEEIWASNNYWDMIRSVCELSGIDPLFIPKIFRILSTKENAPTPIETYYLLDKAKYSVREIRAVTGIYWQQQAKFKEQIALKVPVIVPRILSNLEKNKMKNFLKTMETIFGIFKRIEIKELI